MTRQPDPAEGYKLAGVVVECGIPSEALYRGLEVPLGVTAGYLGRWKGEGRGALRVVLSLDSYADADLEELLVYLRQHSIDHEVETVVRWTP